MTLFSKQAKCGFEKYVSILLFGTSFFLSMWDVD
jgi:hypothetical protein